MGIAIIAGGAFKSVSCKKSTLGGGRLVAVIDNVPAGVCEQCGERYYDARVLKEIELLLKHRQKIKKHIRVPFADFATI